MLLHLTHADPGHMNSWTKPQIEARARPNMLKASAWLNNLYHEKAGTVLDGVDLDTPLSYADRFRMRHPGVVWDVHPRASIPLPSVDILFEDTFLCSPY